MTSIEIVRLAERLVVTGVVQGVGFRPFVHRLATEMGLDGHVGNDSTSVFIDVTGPAELIDGFVDRLYADAPALASIEHIARTPLAVTSEPGFRIVKSRCAEGARTLVAPDAAVCADCVSELFDPANRRFRHPFITCTNCGPRFTIIESVPYDRPNTTMAGFPMCQECDAEYRDPDDRRYHAQPIACADCGPTLSFQAADDPVDVEADPIVRTVSTLANGEIVAIKGLGGYHLACDATNDDAVAALRIRKHRADKPFAIMVASVDHAAQFAHVSDAEAELLASPASPIVLLRAKANTTLSPLVAPGNPLVGIMLAYTPVHHLIIAGHEAPLVMTSANRSGEPIAHGRTGLDALTGLHDAVLDHDRPIHMPVDDSVVRLVGDRLLPIRRARGYAPLPVAFERARPDVLAVGGDLKNTFCVASGGHAWVGQHIGDMANLKTLQAFDDIVDRFMDFYDVHPTIVAIDAHPGYQSSRWARNHHADRVVEVQHHHAHVASVMAEHHLDPAAPVIGFAFDGTGYGEDGTIWGGEVLVANAFEFERIAHLSPIALPGGDAAVRHPCRVALAHLRGAGLQWSPSLAPVNEFDDIELQLLRRQLESGVACVSTTSMGRLFDAVASLLGLRHHITYEAQAAIELEIAATECATGGYRFGWDAPEIVVQPVLEAIVADLDRGQSIGAIAWRFHDAVADIVTRVAIDTARDRGIATVVLGGGTFQNALLTHLCTERLHEAGLEAVTNCLVPPNDGGLALGQAFVAAHAHAVHPDGGF